MLREQDEDSILIIINRDEDIKMKNHFSSAICNSDTGPQALDTRPCDMRNPTLGVFLNLPEFLPAVLDRCCPASLSSNLWPFVLSTQCLKSMV